MGEQRKLLPQSTGIVRKAGDAMAKTDDQVQTELDSIDLELKRVQLEKARLELEQAQEEIAAWKGHKAARSRSNTQRQTQLALDRRDAARAAKECTHRQGGSIREPNKGKGQSALNIVILPDESTLITCANCRLRVFSPSPLQGAQDPKPGESKQEAAARVKKHLEAVKSFEELLEQAQDKLTPEAATPMHCGKTFKFLDRNQNQVHVPRPCDSYAQGLDSRQGA